MANENTQLSVADRFTSMVTKSYADVAKGVVVTEYQNRLIANYFIEIDKMLKASKQGYTWKQVRMNELALTVAHLSRLRLDISLPGTVSFMPFRNKDGTITLVKVIGKDGYFFIAKEYSIDKVKNLTVELVYSNDEFSVVKKDINHKGDSYEFKIKSPFNRGTVQGGFAFLEYEDESLNKLLVMSLEEIMKYRPSTADATFWGGRNLNDMLEKTLAKKMLRKVKLNPDKVNGVKSSFDYMDSSDIQGAALEARSIIDERNGNGEYIDFVDVDVEVIEPVEKYVEPVEDENEVVEPEDDILNMNEQYKMEV